MSSILDELVTFISSHSYPLDPVLPDLPTELVPRVGRHLPLAPRAVLFDVYGTLFLSGSGDISIASEDQSTHPFRRALEHVDTQPSAALTREVSIAYHNTIAEDHASAAASGEAYPEVDILSVWRRAVGTLHLTDDDLQRLAVAYETFANPTWPMPGAATLLHAAAGVFTIGIVSNAQFYTPLLFPALLGETINDFGFATQAVAFSWKRRVAKPDARLFDSPLAYLSDRGIDSSRVVYVGNDMLNDVAAARSRGCMTVLFAGDTRSLRLRTGDPRVESILPDSIVRSLTDLGRILGCTEEA